MNVYSKIFFIRIGVLLVFGVTILPAFSQIKKGKPASTVKKDKPDTQIKKDKPGNFVIKGTVKNFKEASWALGVTSFFDAQNVDIQVSANGSFYKALDITGPQEIYMLLNNNAITILAASGDTLNLDWDNNDIEHTFKIIANKTDRQQETDLMLDLYKQYRKPQMDIWHSLYSKDIQDTVKLNNIKKLFAAEVHTIEQYSVTVNSKAILCNTYFWYLDHYIAALNRQKNNYSFPMSENIPDSIRTLYGMSDFSDRSLNESVFLISAEYRNYVFNKVRLDFGPFPFYSAIGNTAAPNFTLENCYKGAAYMSYIPAMRDWYFARAIMEGFRYYGFADSEQAYLKFLPEIATKEYKDALISFYLNIKSLKPGNPAPIFSLKDANGKTVSLSDLRGKVVYIDFWGVNCGPCIGDIEENAAKFHEKYKGKRVVFLNICVDATVEQWKKKTAELHMEGINLIAEGWVKNPVCKMYNVNGIPHYVLIDANGKLINNNADRMGDLLGTNGVSIKKDARGNNELDMALAAK